MPTGQPALVATITEEISTSGPIPFARFMDLALYHPQHGYYMREDDGSASERIGWTGDYYTSSEVHPVLAQAVVHQARQIDTLLGQPDPFMFVEMGAGTGFFARDVLQHCAGLDESLFKRLRYLIVERSPAMVSSQRCLLAPWLDIPGRVQWLNDLKELSDRSVIGILFSNELVDAFPVHRVRVTEGQPKEVYVDCAEDRFCERLLPCSTPLLEQLRRLESLGVNLPEGSCAEINLASLAWMQEVARVMGRGIVITIDYGHAGQDLYGDDRRKGTLVCYTQHKVSDDPYVRVGWQDMTAHVDFTSLATIGEEAGLHVTGFTNQMSFLTGLGAEEALQSLDPNSPGFQAAIHLLRPEGMGRTFKVLIQHQGLDRPELEGLRFKPFFDSALALAPSSV
jgi:SAM-dependent MidA family methyltransferase